MDERKRAWSWSLRGSMEGERGKKQGIESGKDHTKTTDQCTRGRGISGIATCGSFASFRTLISITNRISIRISSCCS